MESVKIPFNVKVHSQLSLFTSASPGDKLNIYARLKGEAAVMEEVLEAMRRDIWIALEQVLLGDAPQTVERGAHPVSSEAATVDVGDILDSRYAEPDLPKTSPDLPETSDVMPETPAALPKEACVACEGSGKSSSGKQCRACAGSGSGAFEPEVEGKKKSRGRPRKKSKQVSETSAPSSETRPLSSETRAPSSETSAPSSETRPLSSETRPLSSETRPLSSETSAPSSETGAPSSGTQLSLFNPETHLTPEVAFVQHPLDGVALIEKHRYNVVFLDMIGTWDKVALMGAYQKHVGRPATADMSMSLLAASILEAKTKDNHVTPAPENVTSAPENVTSAPENVTPVTDPVTKSPQKRRGRRKKIEAESVRMQEEKAQAEIDVQVKKPGKVPNLLDQVALNQRATAMVDDLFQNMQPPVDEDVFKREMLAEMASWDQERMVKEWERSTGAKYTPAVTRNQMVLEIVETLTRL